MGKAPLAFATIVVLLVQTCASRGEILIDLTNQVWRYDQSGVNSEAFRERFFDDSMWPEGRSILAYENSVGVTALDQNVYPYTNTVLLSPPQAPLAPNHTIDYFRARFVFNGAGDPDTWVLTLSNLVDDAYVAYLNGVEISRYNMNPANDMLAASTGPQGEGIYIVRQTCIPAGTLVVGENVLAVRVHQNAGTSTDVVWGTVLHASPGAAPAVLFPSSQITLMLRQGANTNLVVDVRAAPCATHQWYKNHEPIDGATGTTFAITNMDNNQAGIYFLRSVNAVGTTDSPNFVVSFLDDVTPPTVVSAVADPWDLSLVTVTFSEDVIDVLNHSWIDPVYFYLQDAPATSFVGVTAVGYGASSNVLILTLAEPRDPAIRYHLMIALHAIEDRFGNPLADPTVVPVLVPSLFQDGMSGYSGTQDTDLRQSSPTQSSGTSTSVEVGLSPLSHGLLRFDDIIGSGSGQVPPYVSIIRQARLRLWTLDPNASNSPVRMLRMTAAWDQLLSTWNSMGNGIDQTNGVETGKTDALVVARFANSFVEIDVTEAVQAWAVGASNYGWAFLPTGTNGWRWASSENGVVDSRPRLLVVHDEFDYPACLIVKQPEPLTVRAGAPIFLDVAAIGRPLQYQWFRNGTAIPGATAFTYSVPAATLSHNGAYHVMVHKPAPNEYTCSSAAVHVTVIGSLTIVRESDNSLTLSWAPGNAILQEGPNLVGPWTDIPGAVSPMPIEVGNANRFYRLRSF